MGRGALGVALILGTLWPAGILPAGPTATASTIGVAQSFGAKNTSGSATLSASPSAATMPGDLLVATIRSRNVTALAPVSSVTDTNAGDHWVRAAGVTQGSHGEGDIWYAANAASLATSQAVTVTVGGTSASTSAIAFTVLDVTGASISPLDVTATKSGSAAPVSTGTTATTTQASEVAIGDIGWNSSVTPSAKTAGYTVTAVEQSTVSGDMAGEQAAWRVLTATGAQSYSATLSSTTVGWTGVIAIFKLGTPTPLPTISSFNPTSGTDSTGVTVTGTHFTGVTAVTFNGTAAGFTFTDDSHISTSVPTGATTGPIKVTTPGGTATSATSFTVQPLISGFSPASGPVGTPVQITGSGFTNATGVAFNGTSQPTFTVNNDAQISTTVPSGAGGTGAITVATPGGAATSPSSFTVTPPTQPSIINVNPGHAVIGASVVITGSGFTGTSTVAFNTTNATFTLSGDTQINATVPAGATTGSITVTAPGGNATAAFIVDVSPAPTITGFSPTSGLVGTPVTITGTGFTGASAVAFSGTNQPTFTVTDDSHISTSVPTGAASGPITVTTPGGTATSSPSSFIVNSSRSPIQHVVVLYQENHAFDETLGNWCFINSRCNGIDVSKPVTLKGGIPIAWQGSPDIVLDVNHSVQSQVAAIDSGRMDGWAAVPGCGATVSGPNSLPYGCISYYGPAQIPNLIALATKFAVSDATFSMADSPSWGGHVYAVAATTDHFTGDNPHPPQPMPPGWKAGPGWGCNSNLVTPWVDPVSGLVSMQPSCIPDPGLALANGGAFEPTKAQYVPTIMDELQAAGLTWRIYTPDHTGDRTVCPSFAECNYSAQLQRLVPQSNLLTDAAAGTLSAFSLVSPSGLTSQHNGNSMAAGDNWIGQAVAALEAGPEWGSTAIFITYDDCGCFYDHAVPGVNPDGTQQGIRVPLVIVSPYARAGYTDSTPATFASILAFTEQTFGLAALGQNDAGAYAFSNSFNYGQTPLHGIAMVRQHVVISGVVIQDPNDPT